MAKSDFGDDCAVYPQCFRRMFVVIFDYMPGDSACKSFRKVYFDFEPLLKEFLLAIDGVRIGKPAVLRCYSFGIGNGRYRDIPD